MSISGVSHYRGGTMEEIVPLAKALKASYLRYGVGYRIGRVQDGPNADEWFVIATYENTTAYEKAQELFAQDQEMQQIFTSIAKFAKRTSREMVVELDI